MFGRVVTGLAVALCVWRGRTALAQPEKNDQIDQTVSDAEDIPVKEKSYFVPAAEVLIWNLTLSLSARAAGAPWADTNLSIMEDHLRGGWELDEDAYSTNQIGHPLSGSFTFSMARSAGQGFWVSGLYAIGGSTLWELFFENTNPSINDMITTPIGGMFIGEAMHRFGRALLYRSHRKPTWERKAAASIIDPIGAINRGWWGDAWAKTVPPALNAHFGIGWQQPAQVFDADRGGDGQLHVEAFVEHGLIRDRKYEPSHPLDHFTFQTAVDVNRKQLEGLLYVRGILLGSPLRGDRLRGMYGMYGAYDYNNNHYVRASMLGVGPGGTAELLLGEAGYVAGTAAAYLVPYGAAGGANELEYALRDHHDGPGLAQLVELQGGLRGLFNLRLTTRAYEIQGRLVGDVANELVISSTAGARVYLRPHHAIGAEATYTRERASFEDTAMATEPNRTVDFRAFYAVTTDDILGR